jgi:hypothetical protein
MKGLMIAFRNWLRVVLLGSLTILVLVSVVAWLLLLGFRHLVVDHYSLEVISFGLGIHLPLITVVAYALLRIWYFNPVESVSYGSWLRTTPWRYPDKLPLGPLSLVSQDALLLLVWTSIFVITLFDCTELKMRTGLWLAIAPVVLFLLARGFICCYFAIKRGERVAGYGVPLLFGAALLCHRWPGAVLAIAVLMEVVTHVSLQRMLAQFPCNLDSSLPIPFDLKGGVMSAFAWPAGRLLKVTPGRLIPVMDVILVPLTIAWVAAAHVFFLMSFGVKDRNDQEFVSEFAAVVLIAGSAARLALYCLWYLPPMGILGRLPTWRFIVPGYDYVLVAPICAALIGYYLPELLLQAGLPDAICLGVCLALGLWILLGVGPTLDQWRHTGHHRMIAGTANKKVYGKNI